MAGDDAEGSAAGLARGAARRRAGRPCPVCGRPADPGFRPFCSARCRQVDLGRWFAGDYAVPGEAAEGAAEDEPSR